MPEVTITLRTIDESSEKTKKVKESFQSIAPGIEKAKTSIAGFASANAGLISLLVGVGVAAGKAYADFQKYAGEVRDLALASGTTATEASTLLQVLDDYQLTSADVTAAMRAMKEKGLVPTIDTLADLSDQFLKIQDPAQRLQFAQDNLGRSYSKYLNVLKQGGATLRDNATQVNKNLVLTDEQIKQAEMARLAIDTWADAWEGLKIKSGAALGSIIANNVQAADKQKYLADMTGKTFDQMKKGAAYSDEYAATINGLSAGYERAAQMGDYWAKILGDSVTPAVEDNAEAAKALSDTLSSQIDLIGNMQSSEDSYTQKSTDLTQQRADKEAELAELRRQGYWEQSEQVQSAIQDLEEIKQAEAELTAEHQKQTLEFISGILQQNLARDGWTTAEFEAFAKQQEAWGLWSADVVEKSKAAWEEAQKITDAINGIPTEKFVNIGVVTTYSSQGQAAGPVAVNGANIRNGYAEGTGGWLTVPSGYPNDSYPIRLSSGEKYAVVPQGESISQGGGQAQPAQSDNSTANLIPILQQFADMIARSNRVALEKAGRR